MTTKKPKSRPVLVTTSHRGVFFGYTENTTGAVIILAKARNCIYWPSTQHGFLGLATDGPLEGARVGPAADSFEVRDITGVVACSDKAVLAWERAPWSK